MVNRTSTVNKQNLEVIKKLDRQLALDLKLIDEGRGRLISYIRFGVEREALNTLDMAQREVDWLVEVLNRVKGKLVLLEQDYSKKGY
jgi:BMFP domain-containing protein YqiC